MSTAPTPAKLPADYFRAAPWIAAAAGAAIVLLCFYPGQMSADSLEHLRQARSGVYTDWHSPTMSWWWGCLDRVVPGPFGMLVFQNLLFWSGLVMLLTGHLPPAMAAFLTLAIGLAPCCLGLLGTIWSDVGMGAALLLAVALVDRFRRTGSRWSLGGAGCLLLYACAVRKNAAAAALPVAFWAAMILAGREEAANRLRRARCAGLAVAAVLAMFTAAQLANRALAGPRVTLQSQQLFLHDLAALSVARHENLLPARLQTGPAGVTIEVLQRLYTPESVNPLVFGDGPRLPLTSSPADYAELRRQWWHEIARHPGAYLRHRTAVMAATLGLTPEVVYPYHWGINPNEFGYVMNQSRSFRAASRLLAATKGSLLFRGWFYVLLGAAAVAFARRRRNARPLVLTLVGSGFAYVAPYFLISPAGDFRLIWWMVVAVLVALPVCLAAPPAAESNPR